jgi:hypothetical protein
VDFGAHDLAAPDDLARLGAHGLALQRPLRAGATPLGLGAGNAPVTPELCDVLVWTASHPHGFMAL